MTCGLKMPRKARTPPPATKSFNWAFFTPDRQPTLSKKIWKWHHDGISYMISASSEGTERGWIQFKRQHTYSQVVKTTGRCFLVPIRQPRGAQETRLPILTDCTRRGFIKHPAELQPPRHLRRKATRATRLPTWDTALRRHRDRRTTAPDRKKGSTKRCGRKHRRRHADDTTRRVMARKIGPTVHEDAKAHATKKKRRHCNCCH